MPSLWKSTFVQVYPLAWTYMMYLLLNQVTGTSATVSVVLSGSMEPEIKKGDVLFAIAPNDLQVGDIVLYRLPHRPDIPIVHRITKLIGQDHFLTKGDANPIDDRGLYYPSFEYLPREQILAKVRGHIPWIGWPTLLVQDFRPLIIALLVAHSVYKSFYPSQDDHHNIPKGMMQWIKFLLRPPLS
eukprot:TRINITY_DN19554_c0_g1_i1.p1 TRINITY_DN19554_c0_g1~~TRINITY_DN19554_c0_g1_i1.p1  ORF type:complete len:185 (+),score=39.86 TRINITY_DN19554_c0_g1_i1:43-597(+)